MTEVAHGFAQMALQNQRLETELRSSLRELQASRSRIMSAADQERRRIERDLHDGAQQRLLALTIELELAGELVKSDPGKGAARLRELVQDVNAAMADIRSLAHGLYPSLLVERGLVGALSEAAAACPVPTTLTAGAWPAYPPEIEGAVYFCCREALQNAAKHARGPVPPRSRSGRRRRSTSRCSMTAPAFDGYASHGAGSRTCETGLGPWAERWRSSRISGGNPRDGSGAVVRPTCRPDRQPVARATDALSDCFAIYRAVTDERGNVADFAVEHMNDAARRDLGVGGGARRQTLGRLQPDYLRSQAFRWLRHIVELEVPGGREVTAYEPLGGDRRRLLQSSDIRAAPSARGGSSWSGGM